MTTIALYLPDDECGHVLLEGFPLQLKASVVGSRPTRPKHQQGGPFTGIR